MNSVEKYILTQIKNKSIDPDEAKLMLSELRQKKANIREDIAIIGVACKLPNSNNVDEFWDNILHGRNCFVTKPPEKMLLDELFKNPYYADLFDHRHWRKEDENVENFVGGFIQDFDKFDANFFGIPPREARYIDPQQRVFMEVAWSAIEDAGYTDKSIRDSMTGIFVGRDGTNSNTYAFHTAYDSVSISGSWAGILASRLNYLFNLKGPAFVVDTACSSGLVAIHEACGALRNNECEMAIAGGISLGAPGVEQEKAPEDTEEANADAAVVSDDNAVRTFDKKCSGTVFSEGCTVIVLKPLDKAIKDRNQIYGIIRGSAMNSDGASNGLTAPNPIAQENVIVDAWKRAQINPEELDFIETHGTGTLLGDPIEIKGLTNAFSHFTDKKQFCGVGSVKTNIGHTVGAAGVTNVVKLVLGMRNEVMPPNRNFSEPNPHIDFVDSPVYVVDQPTEWKRGDKVRIAGASAWGYSGTNCHLVVQEPPLLETSVNTKPLNIFTISAKTEKSMLSFIENYHQYFEKHSNLNIADVCFTSNVGRGHYFYRVAILAETFDELKEKVDYLYSNGMSSNSDRHIYFNAHQIVPEKKKQRERGDITQKDISILSQKADELMNVLCDHSVSGDSYKEKVTLLADAYVNGANVQWQTLYEGENVRTVSLPTYPFERISFWGEKRDIHVKDYSNVRSDDIKHEFITGRLVDTINETIYELKFDLNTQWPIQDHILVGNNVVSGTTYVDILKSAFEDYYKTRKIVFEDIIFLQTLILSMENPTAEGHLVIKKEGEKETFVLASKHVDEEGNVAWTEHVRGTARSHTEADPIYPSMDEICSMENVEEFRALKAAGFGDRWNCVARNFRDTNDEKQVFYTFVKLDDKYADDLKTYTYHPGLLDNAINMIMFQIFTGADFYIPFTYKNMKIYKDLPQYFYSKVEKHPSSTGSEVLAFDVTMVDPEGHLLASVEECTIKKVTQFNDYFSSNYYGIRWTEYEESNSPVEETTGNILIFSDKGDWAEDLVRKISSENNNIYSIAFAEEYSKIDDNHYSITGLEEDYDHLLDDMHITSISKVYHLANIDVSREISEYSDVQTDMQQGVYSLVYMDKVFSRRIKGSIDFVIVASDVYKVDWKEKHFIPSGSALLGLVKSLKYECPTFTFRCIEINASSDKDVVFDEIINGHIYGNVAIRNKSRYTEYLERLDTGYSNKSEMDIYDEGAYLITGGTGGLGLVMASNLADYAHCNVCLVARRRVPERDTWDKILEDDSDAKTCNLIRNVRKLEERGCNVIFKQADVSDKDAMKGVVDDLKRDYGRINGVIHCAGVAGDGFILNKPMETFNNVINPKVYGSIVLGELLKDEKLDFFVLFSSMTGILGGPGQGDYTAANAFLDGYANYLNSKGMVVQSINWPGWSETGMAADYNLSEAITMFKSLTNQYGVSILNRLICTDLTNVIPGNINLQFIQNIGLERLPVILSNTLLKDFERFQSQNGGGAASLASNKVNLADIVITGKSEDEYTETERTIAYIYASVLNLNQIDIYDNFSSMGGDSIISTEVFKILNKQYNGILSISDIFLYPTIESIAEYVDKLTGKTEKVENVEEFDNLIDQFEQGDVDIDSVVEFLDNK